MMNCLQSIYNSGIESMLHIRPVRLMLSSNNSNLKVLRLEKATVVGTCFGF